MSSCPANTLLIGLDYLKGKPPLIALPDEEYPPWLWTLLQPKVNVDEGPGSVAEQRRMKAERKANIKYANFLKTQ
jgi:large subunit ribosomal protein L54